MPLHEYLCQDCQSRFELIVATAKADEVPCPMCSGVSTRRLISVFAGVGGRALFASMGEGPMAGGGGGGCCGGAGGCACGR